MEVSHGSIITPACAVPDAQQTSSTLHTPSQYVYKSSNSEEINELKKNLSIQTELDEGISLGKTTPTRQLGIQLNSSINSWVVSWEKDGIYYTQSFPIDNSMPTNAHIAAINFYTQVIISGNHINPVHPILPLLPCNNVSYVANHINMDNFNKANCNVTVMGSCDTKPINMPMPDPHSGALLYDKSLPYPVKHFPDNLPPKPIIQASRGISTRSSTGNNYSKQLSSNEPNDKEAVKYISRARGVYFDKNSQRWFGEHKFQGDKCAQSFSVKKYGYEEARRLAAEWKLAREKESMLRDIVRDDAKSEFQYSDELREYYIKHSKLFPKVRGVWFNSTPHRMGWVGQAYKKCKRIEKIFSVSKHGFERARELAVNFRNSQKPDDNKGKYVSTVKDKIDDISNLTPQSRINNISNVSNNVSCVDMNRITTTLNSSPPKYNDLNNGLKRMESIETDLPDSSDFDYENEPEDFENVDTLAKFNDFPIEKPYITRQVTANAQTNNGWIHENANFNDLEKPVLTVKAKRQHIFHFFNSFFNEIQSILNLQLPLFNLPPLNKCLESLKTHRNNLLNSRNDAIFAEYNKLLGHYYDLHVMPSDLPISELCALLSLVTRQKDNPLNIDESLPKVYKRNFIGSEKFDKKTNVYKCTFNDKCKTLKNDGNLYLADEDDNPWKLLMSLIKT